MNLLAIDTSTDLASVTLRVDDTMKTLTKVGFRTHAQSILPMIQELLTVFSVSLSALNGIVFGQGPGSFTGLRISASIAKGLAYAKDIPLYGVDSLSAIVNETQRLISDDLEKTAILALMDARMSELYWQLTGSDGRSSDIFVTSIAEIKGMIDEPLVIAGVNFEPWLPQLPQAIQSVVVKTMSVYPTTHAMIRLVDTGKYLPLAIESAQPLYIRNQVTQGAPRG